MEEFMNRSQTRELAFKLLYQIEIQKEINDEDMQLFFENNNIISEEAKKYITVSIAIIFGTKVKVCSWILVVAWSIDIIKPTKIETPKIGATSNINVHKVSCTKTTIEVSLIIKSSFKTF